MERTMARLKLAGKRTRGARTLVSLSHSLLFPAYHSILCPPPTDLNQPNLIPSQIRLPELLTHGSYEVVEGAAVAALGEASPHAAVAPV